MATSTRGGKRANAGRKPGSVSRATAEAKARLSNLAKKHTAVALKTLVRVATKSESDSAAVTAAMAILDRAYGKPSQSHELSGPGGGAIATIDLSKLSDAELAAVEPALAMLIAKID